MILLQLLIAVLLLLSLLAAAYYFKHHAKKHSPLAISTAESPPMPAIQSVTLAPQSEVLNTALKNAVAEIKGCQAIAYVDIGENRLMGAESSIPFPQSIVELVAATVTELFTASNLIKVSNAFKTFKGQAADKSNFNEMVIRGEGSVYVFLRAHSNENRVCVFVCADADDPNNNIGLIAHQARSLLPHIEVAAEAAFLVE